MAKRSLLVVLFVSGLCLSFGPDAQAGVESVNFGYSESNLGMTDAIRTSTRIGYDWWSLNQPKSIPELPGSNLPYAYHDGYVEWIGALSGTTKTPAEAAARWRSILTGGGDPWTGQSAAVIGTPTVILLDEISTRFKDVVDTDGLGGQGPELRSALQQFIALGGTRAQIIGLASPSLSQGQPTVANYGDLIYSVNNYMRFLCLELYVTQLGFQTGVDPGGSTNYGTGDTYLANRLAYGARRWTTTLGCDPIRIKPMFLISNRADQGGVNFYKFMNRCYWFLANGYYTASHSVDANIKTSLRQGVGSYSWTPGTGDYQLITSATTRDTYFEKYQYYYCVQGNPGPHPDGLQAPP